MSGATGPGAGPLRVLYIDDDTSFGVLLQRNLGRRGFEVIIAPDGASGLERMKAGGIDVIALDHYLSGETGLDILPAIRAHPFHPPVVYVTGAGETVIAVQALTGGADGYVTKSPSIEFFDLLDAAFRQALDRGRLRREAALAHEAVREARDRAELLLREVNHRVANSLSLAASLTRMQASLITDPIALEALQETQMRIAAIGKVHRHLYTGGDSGMVEIDAYLAGLVEELESSLGDAARPHRLVLAVDPVRMPTDKVVTLGLMVSELLTNAFKYAYPEGGGEIRLRLVRRDDRDVELSVEDDGLGFETGKAPKGTGLGTRILNAMAASIGANLTYDGDYPKGTRAVMVFSLDG